MSAQTITIQLSIDLLRGIDDENTDRSQFVQEAVRHELELRRRRHHLLYAESHPHPESREWAELGIADWTTSLPEEDVSELVDLQGGTGVRWVPGEGWLEVEE